MHDFEALPELSYDDCPCAGRNLDKLIQPAILLALSGSDMHGYLLIQHLAAMPMFGGQKPDPTGVYRFLRQMEQRGLVTCTWDTSESGPAKRLYHLTPAGHGCLARWVDTLTAYRTALDQFVLVARRSTGTSHCCCEDH